MEKMFDLLKDNALQNAFIEFRKKKKGDKSAAEAEDYIFGGTLISDIDRLEKGDYFLPIPALVRLEKDLSGEKRDLFLFDGTAQILLSFMGFILLQKYDHIFSDGLYSFRLNQNNQTQLKRIHEELKDSDEHPYFAFKTDIKGYSKHIDQDILIQKLSAIFEHDPDFMNFLTWLIRRNKYFYKGQIIEKPMAALPGCPLTGFFTNLYLKEVDEYLCANCDFYCRFTDDILVLSREDHKIFTLLIKLRDMVKEDRLELKSVKTELFSPNEPITMLGVLFQGTEAGVSPSTLEYMKSKMRIRALQAVQKVHKTGISREEAAREFISETMKAFQGSDQENSNERNWSRWFFPIITSDKDLREIDHWIQHCVRYILTEKWGKAQYRARYSDLKALGYQSLVHLYHHNYKNV